VPKPSAPFQNFPPTGLRMPRAFIRALGLIKHAAAGANAEIGDLPRDLAAAIQAAALDVAAGRYDDQFPVDVFQTGSGTSSNMNANEVIATLASRTLRCAVHPNDQVNMARAATMWCPPRFTSPRRCSSMSICCLRSCACARSWVKGRPNSPTWSRRAAPI